MVSIRSALPGAGDAAMMVMPKLWQYLTEHWLTLDPDLARSWWFALSHARWSHAMEWREQFVAFARQDGLVTADVVRDFFGQVATLPQLTHLLEVLMQEKVLLARDGKRLEEALLALADCTGAWKHLRERRRA
jgi:hypothetical protein